MRFLLFGWVLIAHASAAADEAGDSARRLQYNNPGLVVDLGVGLWAWPLPMDFDRDGDYDLVVSCPDVPYNGCYFFENPGGDARSPLFRPAVRIGPGVSNIVVSHVDAQPRIMTPGHELTRFEQGDWQERVPVYPRQQVRDDGGRIRANQWSYVDFEGDGDLDVVAGHGSWGDYGWDNAYDADGRWTRGPLHGHVYLLRNSGSTAAPVLGEAETIEAGGKPVDVYGMPSPNLADFDKDGDLDLLCGEFIDSFTYFENVGSRTEPRYAAGRTLERSRQPIRMPLCMIVVTALDWDQDGDVDLIVGQEDGRVALVEHTGSVEEGLPIFETPRFFQQQADHVKFGALATPVGFDWDGDGDEDLVSGNTAGEIGWIENLDGGDPPRWAAPQLLTAGGETIRITAGENGSIQGPAEAKWGYTTLTVADWDHDGLPDLVANSIWGKVVWYRNIGSRTTPRLANAAAIRVAWDADPPRPDWNWWRPTDGELATQWRTTPAVVDWNGDGLNDLVMLDHEGFLALFLRERRETGLTLTPGRRAFRGGVFDAKHGPRQESSDALRLNDGVAGRSGRRKLCVVDWDGDDRLDLLVNSVNANWLRPVDGDVGRITFEDRGPLCEARLAGHTTSPTTVDWNGDGRRDLLLGAEDGHFYYYPRAKSPHEK